MKVTWKGLLAGTAAFAIAACTPADGGADEADGAEDSMMAEEGETEEASAETEEDERDPHGNPAGPLAEEAAAEE